MSAIKLELSIDEVNTILIGLNKAPIPAEVSVPLQERIKNQAIPQVQIAPVEVAKEEPVAE